MEIKVQLFDLINRNGKLSSMVSQDASVANEVVFETTKIISGVSRSEMLFVRQKKEVYSFLDQEIVVKYISYGTGGGFIGSTKLNDCFGKTHHYNVTDICIDLLPQDFIDKQDQELTQKEDPLHYWNNPFNLTSKVQNMPTTTLLPYTTKTLRDYLPVFFQEDIQLFVQKNSEPNYHWQVGLVEFSYIQSQGKDVVNVQMSKAKGHSGVYFGLNTPAEITDEGDIRIKTKDELYILSVKKTQKITFKNI